MVRLLKLQRLAMVSTMLLAGQAIAQTGLDASRHRWTVRGSSSLISVDSRDTSWLDGGLSKMRYDETDSNTVFDRLLIEYEGALTPTLIAQIDADIMGDGDGSFDLTEAFLEWRPVPRSANRHRLKLGAFYPRASLENVGVGWSSPYSISWSAINTWLAEEIRLFGAEWTLSRPLGGGGSAHRLDLFAAAFYGNDPSGTLLAWKGWGLHDRQTRWREQLPLPSIPVLQPGTRMRQHQDPHAQPFLEIDHEPGFHAGAEWRYADRVSLAASRYDNRADPLSTADGQYGWRTVFDHIALRASLPWNLGLMAQWMRGTTAMGSVIGAGRRVVDNDYEASFVMLTRRWDSFRLSLRVDDFEVYDADVLPNDNNYENGDAVTLAYMRKLMGGLTLGVEWQRIDSMRPAREYLGLAPDADERQLRVQLSWQLSNHAD